MAFAISVILILYRDRIYCLSQISYDNAVFFCKKQNAVEYVLRVHIKELLAEFEYYKDIVGTGSKIKSALISLRLKIK